jgi:multidrug efflux pump subunit AcrB
VVTLLSLSLVVGILVDDAIVEIENIMRHLRMGKTPYQAAMEAADEIGLAVIATTFTLIAVFLPTAFMSGVPASSSCSSAGRRRSRCSSRWWWRACSRR